MTRETVDEKLRMYRFNCGRCGHLRVEIAKLESEIAAGHSMIAAEAASIQAQQMSSMPHGSVVGNPTERVGLKLASGWKPEYLDSLAEQLQEMRNEYRERRADVEYVDSWLKGLADRERWVIHQQVIDGKYWKDIIAEYKTAYAEDVSKDTLKRLRQRAYEKIYELAE